MKRRALLLAFGATLANALPLHAQRAARAYRVGFLISGGPENSDSRRLLQAFLDGMKEQGYEDGRNFVLAVRYYGSDRTGIPAHADELIAWGPDVLVANISSTAAVLQRRTCMRSSSS